MGFASKYVLLLVHVSAACDTVLSLEFEESVLLSNTWLINNESWVPRSTDKTFLNHSTVRGYKYWPADHYTQETSEAVTVDVVQMNVTFVWSHFVCFLCFLKSYICIYL